MPQAAYKAEFQNIIEIAQAKNWKVETNNQGHYCFLSPDKQHMVFTGGSPSDFRAIKNLISRLRQRGLDIPHKGGHSHKGGRRHGKDGR